jgi:hypothetical protein
LPNRDDLTLAWGDSVLSALSGRAKARFGAGRWLDVRDGAAIYAVPNKPHLDRCEDCRDEVEAALAAHFGQPVPVRLVIDDGGSDGSPASRAPGDAMAGGAGASADGEHEHVDLSELRDATDAGVSSLERITNLFPGAELVEEPHDG